MAAQYYRVFFIFATLFRAAFMKVSKEPFQQGFGSCYNEPRRMK